MTYRLATSDITLMILESLIFGISDILRLSSVANWVTRNIHFTVFISSNGGDKEEPPEPQEPTGPSK